MFKLCLGHQSSQCLFCLRLWVGQKLEEQDFPENQKLQVLCLFSLFLSTSGSEFWILKGVSLLLQQKLERWTTKLLPLRTTCLLKLMSWWLTLVMMRMRKPEELMNKGCFLMNMNFVKVIIWFLILRNRKISRFQIKQVIPGLEITHLQAVVLEVEQQMVSNQVCICFGIFISKLYVHF